jgi:hypothetical protein
MQPRQKGWKRGEAMLKRSLATRKSEAHWLLPVAIVIIISYNHIRMEALGHLIPEWLLEWLKVYFVPFIKVEGRKLLLTMFKGVADVLLFIGLPLSISIGSQAVWNTRYNLAPTQQEQVARWAGVANLIAYIEDVPPVVPLVLWYKEGGMRAENPLNCEGIMGLYTAVNTGALPCFPPGTVSPEDVAYQLQLGARTFKSYCPEISYTTTAPAILQRCYLYYNAGPHTRTDPDRSAYVMNEYDTAHSNMLHTDIQGRSYRLKALGAWPVHLAMQTQIAQSQETATMPPFLLAPALLAQEKLDEWWASKIEDPLPSTDSETSLTTCGAIKEAECLVTAHTSGDSLLRPALSPLMEPLVAIEEVTCSIIPSMALSSQKSSLVLAPASGSLTRYTDEDGHLAIQIENEEWSIWLMGLRSYVTTPGSVEAGQPVGAIGGVDSQTPAVHYAIYDKKNAGFVDPVAFLPTGACPPAN